MIRAIDTRHQELLGAVDLPQCEVKTDDGQLQLSTSGWRELTHSRDGTLERVRSAGRVTLKPRLPRVKGQQPGGVSGRQAVERQVERLGALDQGTSIRQVAALDMDAGPGQLRPDTCGPRLRNPQGYSLGFIIPVER